MGNTLKEILFLQEILSISTFYLSYQNKLLNYQSQRIPKADTTPTVSCCITKVTNIRHATTNIMSWWRNMWTSSLKLVSAMAARSKKKEGQKNKNLNISRTKELFRWNKKHFSQFFEGLSFGEKIKIWWK